MQAKLSMANVMAFRQFSSNTEHFIIIRQEEFGYKSCIHIVRSLQVGQSALPINEVDSGCVVTSIGKHRIY